jgi:Ca2+-transporting ATPase
MQSFYARPVEEVLSALGSRASGLTTSEANALKARLGTNELPKKEESVWQKYFAPMFNFMMLILLVAGVIQLVLGETISAVSVLVIIFVNAIISIFQTLKAEKTLESLRQISAFKGIVSRDGNPVSVPSLDIVPGDVMLLKQGDYVPADARIMICADLTIDESPLTGESVPVQKQADVLNQEGLQIQEQSNMVFMGTFVTSGNCRAAVCGTGTETQIGKIAKNLAEMEQPEVPLRRAMDNLAKGLGLLVLVVCLALFFYKIGELIIINEPITVPTLVSELSWLVSLAVAAIPFNFPLITTVILLSGVLHLASKKAIVRKLAAIETLGRLSVVCSDKTGTLTKNEMTVVKMFYAGRTFDVTGKGYEFEGTVLENGGPVVVAGDNGLQDLFLCGLLNNNSEVIGDEETGRKKVFGLPTEGALIVLCNKVEFEMTTPYIFVRELAFSSKRKRMSKVFLTETGQSKVFTKGAPEIVLKRCNSWANGSDVVPLTEEYIGQVSEIIDHFARQGLRTLGLASKLVSEDMTEAADDEVEADLTFLGVVGVIDPPRDGVDHSVALCQTAGIKVVMITGDHPTTALSIAQKIGIAQAGEAAVEGSRIETLSPEEIAATSVFARVSPEHKQIIVKALQAKGKVVAMTGDGINDALALENSDVGIAMGIQGTDVAKNAADLILTDDSFTTIETAIYHGRGLFNNIRSNVLFLLFCNLLELTCLTLLMFIFRERMFLGYQLMILYITVHFFPPLGLMFDKYDPDIMNQPPKKIHEPILSGAYQQQLMVQVLLSAVVLFLMFILVMTEIIPLNDANWVQYGEGFVFADVGSTVPTLHPIADMSAAELAVIKARTMAFICVVLMECWMALSFRSYRTSIIKMPFHLGITLMILFVIGTLFLTQYLDVSKIYLVFAGLSTSDLIISVVVSLIPLVAIEVLKAKIRKI